MKTVGAPLDNVFPFFFCGNNSCYCVLDSEHVHAIVALLCKYNSKSVHIKVLKLTSSILYQHRVPEATKDKWRLKDVGFCALTDVLSSDVSDELVKYLLPLGVSEVAEDKDVAIYGHYDVVLAVVRMIGNQALGIKLYVTHLVWKVLFTATIRHMIVFEQS